MEWRPYIDFWVGKSLSRDAQKTRKGKILAKCVAWLFVVVASIAVCLFVCSAIPLPDFLW